MEPNSWNWSWNKPLKSYVIQRLVEEIFMDQVIEGWKLAVRLFFRESVKLFEEYYKDEIILRNRVYTQESILTDYEEGLVEKFNNTLRRAKNLAKKNQWDKLF